MRITKMDILPMGTAWRNLIFIRLHTDEGLVGVGECSVPCRLEHVIGYLRDVERRYIVGADPLAIEQLWQRMYHRDFIRGGWASMAGISAVNMACWDILGKKVGLPLYQLLGGAVRDRIRAYANAWYTVPRTPEAFAEAARKVVQMGYTALKVDPFGEAFLELDRRERLRSIALVEAIRDAVGDDVDIFVEGHCRFTPAQAVQIAAELEPFHPGWFEEPVPYDDVEGLRYVRSKTRIPIATGEHLQTRWAHLPFLERRACDILQTDVSLTGGISELRKIAAMAEARCILMAPHNSFGPVCTAASVHVDATLPNFMIQEVFDDFVEPFVKQAVPGCPQVEDGYFRLPDRPGLGVELNDEVIAAHPPRPIHFDLFARDWHFRQVPEAGERS